MAVAGTAQAALDIDAIYMTSCKDHLDGVPISSTPWIFEIWVDIAVQNGLDHIDVNLPAGGLPDFTIYDGDWEYESTTDYSSLTALQDDYPTGDYLFSFEDSGNVVLRTFTLDYTGLSEPLNPVNFTYPSDNGQTGISTTPTFTWTVDPNAGDALGMWVWDPVENEDKYWDAPVSMDTTSWQPGFLDPNHAYDLEVSVFRVKDGEPGPSLPTMEVDGDTFAYGLLIEHLNEIEFTTVPEPVTVGLLGFGSLALLCTPSKRKKM
jgi:hypothetical protein